MNSLRRVSRFARRVRPGITLAFLLVAVSAGGGPTSPVSVQDPLSVERPRLDELLVLPVDGRLPAQKIVATMTLALRTLDDPSSARIIVTLHEPLGSRGASASPLHPDARRLARIAAVEHDFVVAASRLGFSAERGLSHFAIVIGEISPARLEYLASLPQVKAIQPDRELRAATAEGKALINADDLDNGFGGDGEGVTVVVLDSGINDDHPELAGKVPVHRTYVGGAGGVDEIDHGTKVAGIIAGDSGVAPEATLWDIKVIGAAGSTTTAILIQALDELMPDMAEFQVMVGAFSDPQARFSTPCDSLDPASAAVVNAFRNAGKIMIGSSGNDTDPNQVGVPACLDAILATGSVYDADVGEIGFGGCIDATTAADKIACYSNGGPLVDFYAPGHCTRTAQAAGGFDGCFGGTSASAAYAAGVAAQIISLRPGVTANALTTALKTTGPTLTDSRNGLNRRRIDAVAAFQAIGPVGPSPTATRTATVQPGDPSPTPTGTATVAPGVLPAAPSGLTAVVLSHTAFLLEWTDNSNNETSFRVEGRAGASTFQELTTTAANVDQVTVEGLGPSTSYEFRVRARNASGDSPFSNIAGGNTPPNTVACIPDADTACLLGGKFKVEGAMKNFQTPPQTFVNQVMSFPGGRAESDQAVFFESFNPGNFEVGIKMVNACSLAPGNPIRNFWVFAGGLTNAKTDITVEDTVTGAVFSWNNPSGQFPTSIGDTMAFPCDDLGGTPSCTRNDTTACLLGGRFKVTGSMQNFQTPPTTFVTKVIQFGQNRAETDQAVFHESFQPGNFEVGVKMVDACSLAPGNPLRSYWTFYGGLTNAETTIRVVRISDGDADVFTNPSGTFPTTVGNTAAFDCP